MARTASASVNAAASLTQDIVTGGSEFLTVIGIVGNAGSPAGASGDVGISVLPYLDDKTPDTATLADVLVPALETGTAVLANSKAQQIIRYRVSGIRKVQIQVKNNNVAAKPVEADYDLG